MKLFKKNIKQNKKGFTLIELLTTMVIVAILSVVAIGGVTRYVNRSRDQKVVQTKKNIALAAELYVQANRDMLPKEIGESTIIRVSELKNNNYFKEKIVDEAGKDCIANSYVRVFKYSEDEYSYETVLYCGDEEPNFDNGTTTKPFLLDLKDTDGNNTKILYTKSKDVKKAFFSFTLVGDELDQTTQIYSYSYSILVRTGEPKDDAGNLLDPVEVFNSGNIDAQKESKIEVKSKPLSLYFDFTGETVVYVKVRAINVYGGTLDYVQELDTGNGDKNSQKFNDTERPICDSVQNVAKNDDDWINKDTANGKYSAGEGPYNLSHRHYPAQVQVLCNDKFGSGCQRELFTKSWPNNEKSETGQVNYKYGARWSYIEIQDNAVNSKTLNGEPNKRKCYVRVNVDIQAPTIKLTVRNTKTKKVIYTAEYKDESIDGNISENPLIFTVPDNAYPDLIGRGDDGLKWMNKKNYSDGIEIDAEISDNLYLYKYSWKTNRKLLEREEKNLEQGLEDPQGYLNAAADLIPSSGITGAVSNGTFKVNDVATTDFSGTFKNNLRNDEEVDLSKREKINSDDENVLNNLHSQFVEEEVGPQDGTIKGMRIYHEGRRLGELSVEDKAGNKTTVQIYANIDRTPPPRAELKYTKIGVRKDTVLDVNTCKVTSSDSYITNPTDPNPKYEPADDSNYNKDCPDEKQCHWSKEQIRVTMNLTNQEDNLYENYREGDPVHELSGWWKYVLTINYQDPTKPKYNWGCLEKFNTDEHPDVVTNGQYIFDILPEGVHKVESDSCDNAGNCYADEVFQHEDIRQYVKIDYTKPICPLKMEFTNVDGNEGFHDHLNNSTSDKADKKGNITFILPDGITNPKEVGWLKEGESVVLSHMCHDSTTSTAYEQLWNAPNNFWNNEESFVSPTQSGCYDTSEYNKQSFTYDSDIETTRAGANGFYDPIKKKNIYGDEELDKTIGGHVYDNAGNRSDECPIREVKIDTKLPTCRTLIAYPEGYPVNGDGGCPVTPFDVSLNIPDYPNVKFSESSCSGWLGLKDGGNGYPLASATMDKKSKKVTKKTAIVAQDCDDPKSDSTSLMADVLSTCSNDLMYKVYDFEVQTKIAGAMGVGLGGYVFDNAGNTRTCDADKTLNIDYTAPSCTTTITYPEGNPINGTSSLESGWLGYTDNDSGTISDSCTNGSGTPTGSSLSSVERAEFNHPAYVDAGTNFYSELTRAGFAKMMIRALGIDVSNVSTANATRYYKDLKAGRDATTGRTVTTEDIKYIIAASDRGFFVGYTDQTFKPTQTITRVEMTVAMMQMAQSLAMPDNCDDASIPDISEINDPAMADAFRSAARKCIIIGYEDGRFGPKDKATIAQGVLLIYRVLRDQSKLGYECTQTTNNRVSAQSWFQKEATNAVNSYKCYLASTEVSKPGSVDDPAGNQASTCDTTGDFQGADTTRDKITHKAFIPSGGYYAYDSTVTRADYVKLMLDAAGIAPRTYDRSWFPDVNSSTKNYKYIATAQTLGYVVGDENGYFHPTESLTRAELVTGVLKIYKEKNYDTGKRCNANPPDVQEGKWYTDIMKEAAEYCILVGDDRGMYMPEQYASRAEVVAVLNNAFRKHDGMYCKYQTTNHYTNIEPTHWAYEILYEASNTHTCSVGNADADGGLQGDVGETFVDTSLEVLKNTKKTAIISQKCDDMGTYNSSIGQNNIRSGCDTRNEKALKSKTYNEEMDHKMAGAISVGDNGIVFDYAENWTDCNYNQKNFHWVRIDYTRPVCLVMKSYYQIVRDVDANTGSVTSSTKSVTATRENPDGYDGHWMGEGSYATLQSTCTQEEDPKHTIGVAGTSAFRPASSTNQFVYNTSSGQKTHTYENPAYSTYQTYTPIQSGCWSSKTAKTSYSHELKTDAATPKGFDVDVYVYDLAGNRSEKACERSIVQIDTTAPLCDVAGVHDKVGQTKPEQTNQDDHLYFASTGLMFKGTSQTATRGLYHKDKWQDDGWLNAEYEVRVVSECNVDGDINAANIKKCAKHPELCATAGGFDINNSEGTGCLCSGDNPAAPCQKGYYDTVSPTGNEHQQQRSAVYKAVPNKVFDRMVGSMNEANKSESEGFIRTPSEGYNYDSYTDNIISRGEYAKMVVAALGSAVDCSTTTSDREYLDAGTSDDSKSGYINSDLTMEEAISCATGLGFFEGRDDGCFDPNAGITRAEMIVGGIRMARIQGFSYDAITPSETLMNDMDNYVNKWYYDDLIYAVNNGLIIGESDLLAHGDDVATRAEAVTYLVRAVQKECDSTSGGATGTYFPSSSTNTGQHWAGNYLNEAASTYSCDGIQGNAATVYDHVGNMTTCEKIEVKLDDERPKCKNYILTEAGGEPVNGTGSGSSYKWTGGEMFNNSELIAYSECDDGAGSQCDTRKDKSYSVLDKHSNVTVNAAEWKLTDDNIKKSKSNNISYPRGPGESVVTFQSLGSYKAASDLHKGDNAKNGWVKDAVDNIRSCDSRNPVSDGSNNELVLRRYGIDYIKPFCEDTNHNFESSFKYSKVTPTEDSGTTYDKYQWYAGSGSIKGICHDDHNNVTIQSGCESSYSKEIPFTASNNINTNNWQLYNYDEEILDVVHNKNRCKSSKNFAIRIDNQKPTISGSCTTSASYSSDSGTETVSESITWSDDKGSSSDYGNGAVTTQYYVEGWGSASSKAHINCGGSAQTRTYTGRVRVYDQVNNYSDYITCSSASVYVPGCCDSYTCHDCSCTVSCGCGETKSCTCTKYNYSNYKSGYKCGECGTGGNSCVGKDCPPPPETKSFIYNNIKQFLDF